MEITQQHTAAECDYYSQIVERVPNYIMYIDTGYFAARCTIGNVNKEKGRITYKLCPGARGATAGKDCGGDEIMKCGLCGSEMVESETKGIYRICECIKKHDCVSGFPRTGRTVARRAYVRLTRPALQTDILITVNLTAPTFRGIFDQILWALATFDTQGIIIDSISFHDVLEVSDSTQKNTEVQNGKEN